MRHQMIILLLMAITASSLSNILPVTSISRFQYPHDLSRQLTDNKESRYITRNIVDRLFCNPALGTVEQPKLCKHFADFEAHYDEAIDKDDNYNGEGFRQEQWHNYPRQLDRLQDYFYERHKPYQNKRGAEDIDNNDDIDSEAILDSEKHAKEIINGDNDIIDPLISQEKLFILQIPTNEITDEDIKMLLSKLNAQEYNKLPGTDLSPAMKMLKFKRESSLKKSSAGLQTTDPEQNLPVKKRIFSLWSRLQSLSHRGHELHHRRHLHAFYGMGEAGGGGALTAETRALMRPPGSPLRWG